MTTTGGDIDSYCTKCRLNLEHIVVAMVGGAVVKVKCKTCGGVHRYKDITVERRPAPKRETARVRSAPSAQAVWETALESASGPERDYSPSESFQAGEVIRHAAFGRGVVGRTMYGKCSVLFRDGERLLASSNA